MPTYSMNVASPTGQGQGQNLGMFNWDALFGGMPSWLSRGFQQAIRPQPQPDWASRYMQLLGQYNPTLGPQANADVIRDISGIHWMGQLGMLNRPGGGTSGSGGGGVGLGSITNLMGTMMQAQLAQQRLAQERDLALRQLAMRGIESAGQLGLGAGQLGLGMMQNVVSPYYRTAMQMPTGGQVTGAMRYF